MLKPKRMPATGGADAAEPGAQPAEDPQASQEEPSQPQLEGPGPEAERTVDTPASSDTPIKKVPHCPTSPTVLSSLPPSLYCLLIDFFIKNVIDLYLLYYNTFILYWSCFFHFCILLTLYIL